MCANLCKCDGFCSHHLYIWKCKIIVSQHMVKNKIVADLDTCFEVPTAASQVCGRLLMDSLCVE